MPIRIKRRYHPRKKAVKETAIEVERRFGAGAAELLKGMIEAIELEGGAEILTSDGRPVFIRTPEGIFPTLLSADALPLRRVVVDMGAVPHIADGADVMAPGVVMVDERISAGDCVMVVDERHGRALAIGFALVPAGGMKGPKGRVVRNLHHVGDEVWRLGKLKKPGFEEV